MPLPRFDCPADALLTEQSRWLATARSRLLRRVEIARRKRVLDLGCGYGTTTAELVRRSGGSVVALDRLRSALAARPGQFASACRVAGDARRLPFRDAAFDLIFCQFVWLWLDAAIVAGEAFRVLRPGGALVALEPDYEGMIEHPAKLAARDLWLHWLARSGADPAIGRKLSGLLDRAGFKVEIGLLDRLEPPSPSRFKLLGELATSDAEREQVQQLIEADAACSGEDKVAHLPVFLVTATRPERT